MNHGLEKVSCKHHRDGERSRDVSGGDTETRASTFDCPPEIYDKTESEIASRDL